VRVHRLGEVGDCARTFGQQIGNAELGSDVDRLGNAKAADKGEHCSRDSAVGAGSATASTA
jgi:hypothetical protein